MKGTMMLLAALTLLVILLPAAAEVCPMNITRQLDARPWIFRQCLLRDLSDCCDGINDLIKSLHFSSRSFLLPDNKTVHSCIDELKEQLIGRGIDYELIAICRHPPNNRTVNRMLIVTAVPSLAVLVLLLVAVYGYLRRLRGVKEMLQRKLMIRTENIAGLIFFDMAEVKQATGDFKESNLVGEGSFGMVYKLGALRDGSRIAVKRFKEVRQRVEEFSPEVHIISSAKHRNLLPPKGYSVGIIGQEPEQVLVYDLMENGSLADYFFSSTRPCLTWPQRLKIIVRIARGLAYLHEDAKPAILHRDVKAANVLLDEELNPLVADFGMAKFKTKDKTHYTTHTVGTVGYMAPEYALCGYVNDKSDVFSFGIVMLELLTGRRAFDSRTNRLEHVLVCDWVIDMIHDGKSGEILDERIRESGCRQSMDRVLLLALQCAHPRVECRPSIGEALVILEGIEKRSPSMVCAMQSMEVDLESQLNNRGEFTWLISSDTADGSSSGSHDFSV